MKILGELLFSILARSIPDKKADILKGLSPGQEFEGLVLGKQGLLELIEFRGQVIRAQSETPLTQGAKVRLKIINTEEPIRVRLVKQEVEGRKNDIHKDYLNLKASELRFRQAIRTLLTNSEKEHTVIGTHEDMASSEKKASASLFTRLSDLITRLAIDEEPSTDKIKALFSIMQKGRKENAPLLKTILIEALGKVDASAGKKNIIVENSLAKTSINGLAAPGGNKDESETENQGYKKTASQGLLNDRDNYNSSREGVKKASADPDLGPFDTTNRLRQAHGKTMSELPGTMLGVSKKQGRQHSIPLKQAIKLDASLESAQEEKEGQDKIGTQHKKINFIKETDSFKGMDGKISAIKGQQAEKSLLFFNNIQSKGTLRCTDNSPPLSSGYEKVQAKDGSPEPLPTGYNDKEEGGIISKRPLGPFKAQAHLTLDRQDSSLNMDDAVARNGKSSQALSSGRKQFQRPVSKRPVGHVEPRPDTLQQGADPALKAHGFQALKESVPGLKGIQEALSTLSAHIDSAQQYQAQAGDSMPSFLIIPLWFGQAKGAGHLAIWNDLEEHGEDVKGNQKFCQNLFFDLELSRLGPVRIHVRMHEKGLLLSIWARQDPLMILRSSLSQLTQRLSEKGLVVQGVDLSPFELIDSDLISSSKGVQEGFHWVT